MSYLVDDLYQQGLKLHGSGKVELACQVYTLVLNAHPEHSMANHSLGVLCVDIGKVQEALPFFEAALEANADVAQFWVSYIDALINVERIADAHAVFGQAKSNGAKGEGFDKLEQRLTNAREEPLTANSTGLEEKQPKHSNILDSLKLDQAINLAKKRVQEGATEEAKRIFQDILTKSPKNKRAGDGLKALASRSAGDASKIQDPPRGQLQALINLYSQSQLQEALKEAESLIQSFPQSAILFNVQGAVFKDLGRLDQSIEAYNKALATKPDYAEAYNNMGNTFKEQGKLEEAIEAYNKAIIIKPDNTDAYNNMGNAMKEQGKLEEAIGAYNKALDIKPDNAKAYYNMGLSLQEQGKLEEAIEAYKKSLAIKPDNADAYYNMGNALKEQDKLEEATEAYNKALAIKPNDADAYYNMGVTLQGQGKLEEAIEAYNRALAIKPDYADAYYNMGVTLKEQGKLEEAIEAYNIALAIKPDYAEAYFNMGVTLKEQSKLEEAIEAYNKALAIKPDNADAYYNMGNALVDQGKLEEAIEAYNKALAIKPDNADAYNNIGNALKDQGKLEEAIKAYNKALVIKPDYAEAYSNMSFAKLSTSSWREGIELRKWRWHTKKHQTYNRSFSAREWDGNEATHDKTLLVWAEQGPGDVVIWASCISHYAKICGKIIIECHPKLVELFKRSFPNVMIRSSDSRSVDSPEDFDFQVPMETLFGYACLEGACTETQSSYLFPDPKRVKHWSTKLRNISSLKTVGLSWKSPIMTTQRAKNYPELSHWGKTLQKYKSKFIFVNLQSTDYRDDITYFKDHFGCEIVHFDQLDLYNDLSDVAALSQALDCSISVATAAATISAAVGTQTIIPTWNQSSWNNILFNSRGPAVEILLKNTSASWTPVFEEVATKLKVLDAEC